MINRGISIIVSVALAVSAIGVVSCAPGYKWTKCRSYVGGYDCLNSVLLWSRIDCPDFFDPGHCSPEDIFIHQDCVPPFHLYSMKSTGEDAERYDHLCIKHNDMSYNQYRSIGLVRDSTPVYNDIDFTAIEITADIDFDETHPAGSSLADVVRLMSWSPYPYILSGYSQYYHYDKSDVRGVYHEQRNAKRTYCLPWF